MGIRWNCLGEAVLTSTYNLCFEQKYEKISEFLSENFQFWVVNFSVYLNRHVFVMRRTSNEYSEHIFNVELERIIPEYKSHISL